MKVILYRTPKAVREIARTLAQNGHKAYVVGGSLRDHLLGRDAGQDAGSDIDMASDASPEEILRLFRRVVPTGIKHGTVTILCPGMSIEMTTFRSEKDYRDGRRPGAVEYVADIQSDLARRDFTMNAMAFDPLSGEFIDPFDGRSDIAGKIIRSVGKPLERFSEDGLRPMRAIRFAAQLGFIIEASTLECIPRTIDTFKKVSVERLRDELGKILLSDRPSWGLSLLEQTGLMDVLLPELMVGRGCRQKGAHSFDVLDHLYFSVDAAPKNLAVRLAALFHDIGKPEAMVESEGGELSFHRHEMLSASIAAKIMKRLKYPNDIIAEVVHLVRHHMFNYSDEWSDAAVRRFVAAVGRQNLESLFLLRCADSAGTRRTPPDPRALDPLRRRIENLLAQDSTLGLKDLKIDGNDLAEIGIPRGPVMGRILAELLETVLDDPEQNNPESLLRIARGIKGKYGVED
ncbi:MAG: HD domain-containing protein [Spirochaetia bacterium]|nr:HD domain-containing protein [Spirochaetia bacterium]